MEKEEMKQLLHEVIQEREEENVLKSNYENYRFFIVLWPILFVLGFILYILGVSHIQMSPQFLKNILLHRVSFFGSILLMSISLIGVLLALRMKPKNWKPQPTDSTRKSE